MKTSTFLSTGLVVLLFACQKPAPVNQAFLEGPEIDMGLKQFAAWASGDWATMRSSYADTATSTLNNVEFTADSVVGFHRARRTMYDNVEFRSDEAEHVKYLDGSAWTHIWGGIKLQVKGSGKVVEIPIHVAQQVAGGKVAREYIYYNTHDLIVALQEASAAASSPAK